MSKSLYQKVGIASLILMASVFLSRVIGLFREMAIAYAGGMLLGPVLKMEGFSWGVLAGSFIGNFVIQYRGARKVGMKYTPTLDFTHPDFLVYIRLSLPLMVGLTMSFSTEFFLKFFGSYLPEGSIACLNYGLRIMFVLVGLLGQAIGTASVPYMARLAAENQIPEMNRLLDNTLKYLSLIIPFSMLLIILRHEERYYLKEGALMRPPRIRPRVCCCI